MRWILIASSTHSALDHLSQFRILAEFLPNSPADLPLSVAYGSSQLAKETYLSAVTPFFAVDIWRRATKDIPALLLKKSISSYSLPPDPFTPLLPVATAEIGFLF